MPVGLIKKASGKNYTSLRKVGMLMSASAVNQATYMCPTCARVLVTYIRVHYAPVCTRCSQNMVVAPTDTVSGQLTLFRRSKRKSGKSKQ